MSYTEPDELHPMTEGEKAVAQVEADFINGIAVNLIAVGVIGVLLAFIFGSDTDGNDAPYILATCLVCFAGAAGLHLWARNEIAKIDR